MTVRDPTPELELRLSREKAGDFEWAFNRLVDIMAERIKALPPGVREVSLELVSRSFEQLHLENLERRAMLTRMANDGT